MNETAIRKQIQAKLSTVGGDKFKVRLFRNNTGAFLDGAGHKVTFGLCVGSADLIGFKSITITPEMVGLRVAVFLAIEVKSEGKDPTPEQEIFLHGVKEYGGISFVARSVEEAVGKIGNS